MKGTRQASLSKKIKLCVWGIGIDTLLVLLGALLIAICIHNEYMNINTCNPIVLILRFLTAFISGFIVCKGRGGADIASVMIACSGIILTSLCLAGVFFQIDLKLVGWGFLAIIGGEMTAVVVCRTTNKTSVRRKRRRSTR